MRPCRAWGPPCGHTKNLAFFLGEWKVIEWFQTGMTQNGMVSFIFLKDHCGWSVKKKIKGETEWATRPLKKLTIGVR